MIVGNGKELATFPDKPLPVPHYVDANASPEAKHAYRVVVIHGVGLTSELSAEARVP